MPIQVRCRGCEKTLNAPDAARGKVIQCPKCGTKLRIPEGKSNAPDEAAPQAAPAKPAQRRKPAPQPATADPEDIFSRMRLDDAMMEHSEEQICPYCAGELDEDDVICPSCGMNLETGRMDAREQKKRTRKGPDPSLFYKKAWGEGWSFMLENWGLALRTGLIWLNFALYMCISIYMFEEWCKTAPTKTFWGAMTILNLLGIPGWYWYLSLRIISAEWFKEKLQTDRIHFDFFANVSVGLRAILWPFVVCLPIWLLLAAAVGGFAAANGIDNIEDAISEFPIGEQGLIIVGSILFGLPFLAWPLANVHLVTKYTHPAWIGWELLTNFFRNAGASLYTLLISLVMALPVVGILAGLEFAGGGANPFTNHHITGLADRIVDWIGDTAGESWEKDGFMFGAVKAPIMLIFGALTITPTAILAGFPAIFMMRVNALLAHYRRNSLGVIQKIEPLKPAGFWIRFHAFCVDACLFPLSSFLVTKEKKAVIVAQLLNAIALVMFIWMDRERVIPIMAPIWILYNFWMYFAIQESAAPKATVGKDVFKIIVVTNDNKQMTIPQATKRWFLMLVTPLIGALFSAFTPDKKTLYDSMSGTKVVYSGDK
jgi:uncharacterized RDD family membrane protein YckC